MLHVGDADREQALRRPKHQLHGCRPGVGEQKQAKGIVGRPAPRRMAGTWPGARTAKTGHGRNIHVELEALINASAEQDSDGDDGGEADGAGARNSSGSEGELSLLAAPRHKKGDREAGPRRRANSEGSAHKSE
ncbi:hypothetical protein ACJQWK_01720 [Exserohilum turcicum]